MSLREGCKEILKADCVDLETRLCKGLRRGIKVVEEEAKCAICTRTIFEAKPSNGVIVFFCHHIYHQTCLRQGTTEQTATNKPPLESPMKLKDIEKLYCTICQSATQKSKGMKGASSSARKLGASPVVADRN